MGSAGRVGVGGASEPGGVEVVGVGGAGLGVDVGVVGCGLGFALVGEAEEVDVVAAVVLGSAAVVEVGVVVVGVVEVALVEVAVVVGLAVGTSVVGLVPSELPVIAVMMTPTRVITLAIAPTMRPMAVPIAVLPIPGI